VLPPTSSGQHLAVLAMYQSDEYLAG